ncbi:MAG TPA: hypothetical protein VF305_02285 [Smithellaceae bacterium]
MLKVIEDQLVIKKYAKRFAKKFKPLIDEEIKAKIGHQGASFRAKVLWSKSLGTWKFSRTIKGTRYWNAFGVGKPQESSLLSITAEINFPWAGIDRKTGGAFAEDAWGNVFVIHRGKIGGGKKGVGKSLFEHNYRGVWSFMEDGKSVTQVAIIGALNSSRFALQAAQFIKKIEKLKSTATTSTQTEINFLEITFREDLVGSAPYCIEDEIISACDRDLVIGDLAALLQRRKLKIGNDTERELFVVDPSKNRISHVFEVLTDTKEKSVLAAAAKLLLQTSASAGNPLPILVLPEDKINKYEQELQRINISVIGFRWEGEKAVFPELEKIEFK